MKFELVLDEVDLPWEPPPAWTERMVDFLAMLGRSRGTLVPVLQVVLTDDATLREHNRQYRGEDDATDVLSFSYLEGHEDHRDALVRGEVELEDFLDDRSPAEEEPLAGQVLVSLQTLERRGPVHTGDRVAELAFMVVHGALHVLGHDHADAAEAKAMRGFERQFMEQLGYALVDASGGYPEGVQS